MAMGQRDGNGWLDCDGNERLGYGWLGNGQHNCLVMDSLTTMQQQWLT
jgi:hypothetical protein